MNKAILIIDMQNDFFEHDRLLEHRDSLIKSINELTHFGRSKNIPIIWIRQIMRADLSDAPLWNKKNKKAVVVSGTDGVKLLSGLVKEKNDYEITKKRFSGFFNTNLYKILQDLKIKQLVIAGINTMTCVRTTAIDAYMRDYEVIIALDCVDGHDKIQHETSIVYLQYAVAQVKTNKEIFEQL